MRLIQYRTSSYAYLLLVATKLDLALLALSTEAGDVARKVQHRTLLRQDGRGIGSRAGHVEATALLIATSKVAEGNELEASWCGHCLLVRGE